MQTELERELEWLEKVDAVKELSGCPIEVVEFFFVVLDRAELAVEQAYAKQTAKINPGYLAETQRPGFKVSKTTLDFIKANRTACL